MRLSGGQSLADGLTAATPLFSSPGKKMLPSLATWTKSQNLQLHILAFSLFMACKNDRYLRYLPPAELPGGVLSDPRLRHPGLLKKDTIQMGGILYLQLSSKEEKTVQHIGTY